MVLFLVGFDAAHVESAVIRSVAVARIVRSAVTTPYVTDG